MLVDNNNTNVLHGFPYSIVFTLTHLVICSVDTVTDEICRFVYATARSVCRIKLSEMCVCQGVCILNQRR